MAEDKEAFQKFFKAALEGGWGLLQHYLCRPMPRDRHQNMTGGGLGNILGAHQRPGVPLSLYTSTTQVGGNKKKTDDKKICIKMLSPPEQMLQQAKSQLKREREVENSVEEEPNKKRRRVVYDVTIK